MPLSSTPYGLAVRSTWLLGTFLLRTFLLGTFLLGTSSAVATDPAATVPEESSNYWYQTGQTELSQALHQQVHTGRAKNIILFVGDGMGVATVTAARIFAGQLQQQPGEEFRLSFEQFPYTALAKTYNTNQQTSDSAGTMTAMMTGVKTRAGVIGIHQAALRGDCASAQRAYLPNFLQQAEQAGLATGIVTTTRITHATPAATYAHSPERDWENDTHVPAAAKAEGCEDIASQLVGFAHGDGMEVVLGGGLHYFLPQDVTDPVYNRPGNRRDGRHLIKEWQHRYPQGIFVQSREQLEAVDFSNTSKLFGLFSPSHLSYATDRQQTTGPQPSLPAMTAAALKVLQQHDQGYFLMVEAGRIDHAHHAGNAQRALNDTVELAEAVALVRAQTDIEETLIIVTADHSHTFTMAGYPTRGNPILGKVIGNDTHGQPNTEPSLAGDGQPYTTLGYNTGRGFAANLGGDRRYLAPAKPGRQPLAKVDTEHPNYHQEALVPLEMETHGGEDVAIYASGPWAHLFHSTHEQHFIYHVMRHAARLDERR